ncbi:hypothetical protein C8R43DRAFT_942727 [Mycena crocata]|nr:hypothetical protein C8R43DRAFT_961592 [Mycena crocata]KAJ7177459.1 hypothetical protein C8R43DRAFT_942727 [Mycena crocata]
MPTFLESSVSEPAGWVPETSSVAPLLCRRRIAFEMGSSVDFDPIVAETCAEMRGQTLRACERIRGCGQRIGRSSWVVAEVGSFGHNTNGTRLSFLDAREDLVFDVGPHRPSHGRSIEENCGIIPALLDQSWERASTRDPDSRSRSVGKSTAGFFPSSELLFEKPSVEATSSNDNFVKSAIGNPFPPMVIPRMRVRKPGTVRTLPLSQGTGKPSVPATSRNDDPCEHAIGDPFTPTSISKGSRPKERPVVRHPHIPETISDAGPDLRELLNISEEHAFNLWAIPIAAKAKSLIYRTLPG